MSDHPPLKFAAIGLDHRHIYHQVGRLLELGAECKGYYTRDSAVPLDGFVRRFPDLPRVRDVRALLENPEIQLIVTAAMPSERGRGRTRGDASRQGRHGRQPRGDHAGAATILGMEGYVELRKYVDIAGREGYRPPVPGRPQRHALCGLQWRAVALPRPA